MKRVFILIELTGIICMVIGMISLTGYAIGNEHFYSWNKGQSMALNTSIAITAQGVGTILMVIYFRRLSSKNDR